MSASPAPGGGGLGNTIIITIQAATAGFTNAVKVALNGAVKLAQTAGTQISGALSNAFKNSGTQQLNQQLQQMGTVLADSTNQLKQLTAGVNQYRVVAAQWALQNQGATKTWVDMLNVASQYGITIQQAGKYLIQTGQATVESVQSALIWNQKLLLSEKELVGTLANLEENIKRVARGEEMITQTTKGANDVLSKQANIAEQNAGILSFLQNRIKAVVTSLIVAGATYKFGQFLQDLTKESTEVSQSLFNFETAIKASEKVLGHSAGTLGDWTDTIRRLRDELKVFSERDIRDSTTQVINLTKVLKLSQSDIEDIIRVSAALAETTGVDLNQAVSDVVHALGGSRVVLDKYGLFIRDADLRTQSLTDGLGSNTAALTSQQLALVTLHEILRQTNPLINSLTGYEDSLAGQVKETEADIKDSTDVIAERLGTINLLFKTLYAEFIAYIADVSKNFKPLMDYFDEVVKTIQLQNELTNSGAIAPDPTKFNGYKDPFSIDGRPREGQMGQYKGVPYYTPEQVFGYNHQYGTPDDWNAYADALQKFYDEVDGIIANHDNKMKHKTHNAPDYLGGLGWENAPVAGPSRNALPEDAQNSIDKFNKNIDDLIKERQRKLEDAFDKYNQDWKQIADDETADFAKLGREFLRKLEDIDNDLARKIEDARTDYERSLSGVDSDEASKLEDIEKEKNDKLIEIKDDYYDALKQLDRQYYFDLFDASANNDAVALKNAERKYNLEKAKLKDKLDDDTEKTNKNAKDSIEDLKKETNARRQELYKRYQQELEDAKLDAERKRQDAEIDRQREYADLKQHYADLKAELKEKYHQEQVLIDKETGRRYNDLVSDLHDELDEYEKYFQDLLDQWDAYFDDLLKLEQDYKDERDDKNSDDPPTPTRTPCPAGQRYDTTQKKCVNDNKPSFLPPEDRAQNTLTANTANTHTIILTSDGSVGDEAVEKVAGELANVFENIITRRGSYGRE